MRARDSWDYSPNCLMPEGVDLPPGISRFAAAVEYNGALFCGWQRQLHSPSVQSAVEQALTKIAASPVKIACAGRTDTGVHATNQIIHFDTAAQRSPRNWLLGANTQLPDAVRIHWVATVEPRFHARFSALSRTYRYIISNEPVRPALFRHLLTWCKQPLDADAMHAAAQQLLGENDYSSFRSSGCQSKSPFRSMAAIRVYRQQQLVIIEVTANAFLHHMVRNIAGALLAVGKHEKPVAWVGELLQARDRTLGEVTAPADGLYLVNVAYPPRFGLPEFNPGPPFVVAAPDAVSSAECCDGSARIASQ